MFKRTMRLFVGLLIISIAITLSLKVELGLAPWEVFHSGISNLTNISIGQVSIYTGLIIIIISYFFGITPGFGTIMSMVFVGIMVDLLMNVHLEPFLINYFVRLLVLIISLFIMSYGLFLYIGAGLGAGPRDSVMVLFAEKSNLHSGTCKVIVDSLVLIVGIFAHGQFGVGTIISVLGLGYAIKVVFNYFKFDVTSVEHISFVDFLKFKEQVYLKEVDQNYYE